jgi:hypothetical protein
MHYIYVDVYVLYHGTMNTNVIYKIINYNHNNKNLT